MRELIPYEPMEMVPVISKTSGMPTVSSLDPNGKEITNSEIPVNTRKRFQRCICNLPELTLISTVWGTAAANLSGKLPALTWERKFRTQINVASSSTQSHIYAVSYRSAPGHIEAKNMKTSILIGSYYKMVFGRRVKYCLN
jgi:hypothetical protein